MKLQLYKCANDVVRALDELADNDEQWAQDTIEAVIGQFEHKATSVAAYMLNTGVQIDMLDAHIKAMQAKKKAMQNRQEGLKKYLTENMRRAGILEIKANDGTFTAKFAKNPPRVEVYDTALLPEILLRITVEPDKTAIKKEIESGNDVPGAKIVHGAESLRIR